MARARSVGVTLSAVVAILGSALAGLAALLTLFAVVFQPAISHPPPPPPGVPMMPATLLKLALVFVVLMEGGLAAWGITTAIGLIRLRSWARWSIMIFSGLLAFMGGSSALMISLIPLPPTPNAPPEFMANVKLAIAIFYGLAALLGIAWLVYFNLARVRAQFGAADTAETPVAGGRPLSVSIIACYMLITSATAIIGAFLPFPVVAFGLVLRGWPAHAFYFSLAVAHVWIAIGLLQLRPLSRILAIGLFAYGIVSSALFILLPGFDARIHAMMDGLPTWIASAQQSIPPLQPVMLLSMLVGAVPIWFLIARREAFRAVLLP